MVYKKSVLIPTVSCRCRGRSSCGSESGSGGSGGFCGGYDGGSDGGGVVGMSSMAPTTMLMCKQNIDINRVWSLWL